ncbi:MAG: hypothetical protein J7496_01840 [Novosphingobium sp.]|nr:hypothetical protein [Novosphingobium sp.]
MTNFPAARRGADAAVVRVNLDVPEMDIVLVEIASAVRHACGVRLRSFPIQRDKLLAELPEV